jgi:D-alanine-D-alanine ligase-like ATP-grasp enzyme
MDYHIVTLLELHGIPYTGSNPKGLVLARDKALNKERSYSTIESKHQNSLLLNEMKSLKNLRALNSL